MVLITGHFLSYEPFSNNDRVHANHILFGRVLYRKYRSKKYAYYVQGMLDKTKFYRIKNSQIFVTNIDDINLEELRIFCKVIIKDGQLDLKLDDLITAKEHWYAKVKSQNLEFRERKRRLK